MVTDLNTVKDVIGYVALISLVVAFLFMVLVYFFAGPMVWVCVILFLLSWLLLAWAMW